MNQIEQATEREACRKAFELDLIDNWAYVPKDMERTEVGMYLDDDLEFAWECAWASWQTAIQSHNAVYVRGDEVISFTLADRP